MEEKQKISNMKSFRSLSDFYIESKRYFIYTVELDETVEDFSNYRGQKILINDKEVTCCGVEFFAHTPPWTKGEKIGICVQGENHGRNPE
jgi:hypothetical protein